MYQGKLKFPWMYVDTVFCAFVRSCWMAHITSYRRSISLLREYETNTTTRNVQQETQSVVTIAMICSTLASSWKFKSFQSCIYPVEYIWWSAFFAKIVLISGVIQENNSGVGRDESSKPHPNKVSYVQLGGLMGAVSCPSRGCFGTEPPYKNCFTF